ncbi:FabD/lysophospholipase-like protein [Xylona heveae TC161]|uniref:FabD/lysophospholipase-like protein n=1 Tax=Xylona heveae (strain CBS 132557 / TC161) TaxID=1328760 RepID=A0A165FVT3_XYLHT|nr:FabD/lysophospholipase-like protein [Xylona heveae TC161]KZF21440.1 FabD/lysophospholipase-like protein [Xylona heveae TC161]
MNNTSSLRRKDTTKGPPLRILSLDGGGVRGYSMLILLQELMHRTYVEIEGKAPKRDQIPKPCDHFDLIAGTGTGGLIAIMLGRLRLDIETCKEVYVRMTRRVFETDKTFAGIPYRSTLFKASKLEDAIRDCVREHTIFEEEGNDGELGTYSNLPMSPMSAVSRSSLGPSRSVSVSSGTRSVASLQLSNGGVRWGNPNAALYDARENRTKTAVTAVYKGTPKNGLPALLRSYDSRKEPAPEFNCTIWQAGRATCATGLAFKPIQVGQSVFIDEGAGKYNPSPVVLDEALLNEWPGRDLGIFVSIGTGKRPAGTSQQSHLWWEGFMGGLSDFAEARRRLISKIEGCEDIHQYMRKEHFRKRGANPDNYYRLNVEVGVGEFGMNEWNRLADISTSTRRYLGKSDVQKMNMEASAKLGRIHRARQRYYGKLHAEELDGTELDRPLPDLPPPEQPLAVELPANEIPISPTQHPSPKYSAPQHYPSLATEDDKFAVISSDEYPQPVDPALAPRPLSSARVNDYKRGDYRSSNGSIVPSPRGSGELEGTTNAPPLPPKTPLPYPDSPPAVGRRISGPPRAGPGVKLPYPVEDGPPPVVNMARKPEYGG